MASRFFRADREALLVVASPLVDARDRRRASPPLAIRSPLLEVVYLRISTVLLVDLPHDLGCSTYVL